MIRKLIIILILSSTVGAGYVLAETEIGGGFPLFNSEAHQVPKKISAVKTKSFYSKRKASHRTGGLSSDQYSFFRVLNDPSLSKMVDLNGKIIRNYEAPPTRVDKARVEKKNPGKPTAPVFPAKIVQVRLKVATPPTEDSKPQKAVRVIQRKTFKPTPKPVQVANIPILREKMQPKKIAVKPKPGRLLKTLTALETVKPNRVQPIKYVKTSLPKFESYVVQVSAFKQLQRSQEVKGILEKKGYPAFIEKTKIPGNGGAWYRVNIGRYFNHAGAELAAKRFFRRENHKAMVIRQAG